MTAELKLPPVEQVAEQVHQFWAAQKISNGVTSHKSARGEELLVPYSALSEEAKDLDRTTVRCVYAAILLASRQ